VKFILLVVNGFTILYGLFLTLFALSIRRGCDLLPPDRGLFDEIMCFPALGPLSPVLVVMPFIVASVILNRRGQAAAAAVVACLPLGTVLLILGTGL
jgi:hypothetical protein